MADTQDQHGTEDEDSSVRRLAEPVKLAVDSRKSEDEQVDDLVAELTALGMNPDREALRTVVRQRMA